MVAPNEFDQVIHDRPRRRCVVWGHGVALLELHAEFVQVPDNFTAAAFII
jgi:hypothetical protein